MNFVVACFYYIQIIFYAFLCFFFFFFFFFVLSGFYVTFNDFSVISWRCLDVAESSMLPFSVLLHWNISPETLDMIFHPVTLYWHWAHQFWFQALLSSCWTPSETAASAISFSLWYHSAGDRTHNLTVTKRTFYGLSRCPNLRCSRWKILLPMEPLFYIRCYPASTLYKSTDRVADRPITACCRFM